MADLRTTYMGLALRNPVILSSSDLTSSVDNIVRAEDAGAAAVVLKSIFEEQFLLEGRIDSREAYVPPEARDYLQSRGLLGYATAEVFRLIEGAKRRVSIPIIASINCQTADLWPTFARHLEVAGADGLELNVYFLPLDLETSGEAIEDRMVDIVSACSQAVRLPLAVKLPFQVTSLPHLADRLHKAGCQALVLFNWFLETDIDLKRRSVRFFRGHGLFPHVLRWVGLLAGRVKCDLAASGGVMTPEAAVKLLLAGANAVQVCRLVYDRSFAAVRTLIEGIDRWLTGNGYSRVDEIRGELSWKELSLSQPDPRAAAGYFRGQYIKAYTGPAASRPSFSPDEEDPAK